MGEFFVLLVFAAMFGVPAYLVWYFLLGGKGKRIRRAFQNAGDLRGKTLAQVQAIAGAPARVVEESGAQVVTWGDFQYGIALVFRNGVCEGVSREVSQ